MNKYKHLHGLPFPTKYSHLIGKNFRELYCPIEKLQKIKDEKKRFQFVQAMWREANPTQHTPTLSTII